MEEDQGDHHDDHDDGSHQQAEGDTPSQSNDEEQQETAEKAENAEPIPEISDKVQITFIVEESDEKFSSEFALKDSIGYIKEWLSVKWIRNPDTIQLSYVGETLSNATTVEQLGPSPDQPTELSVHILVDNTEEREQVELHEQEPSPTEDENQQRRYVDERLFAVQVRIGQTLKEVLVTMEKQLIHKPFLGGYRSKLTGVEYHNASTQTLPKLKPKLVPCFERDTQTVVTLNKRQQVMVDAATQMNQTGCYITKKTDEIIIPRKYQTADEYHAKILEKVIILQSYWRRWLDIQYVKALRKEKYERMTWEEKEAARKAKEREERKKREFDRRMNPKTKEDFELLYHALEMWRQDELNRINSTTSGPERKAALCLLLEQEAHLIASIGRHKIVADEKTREEQVVKFLEATSAPKKWIAYDGEVTKMDTEFTLRASKLKDLYQTITMKGLDKDERLDALLTLKKTVREHDCRLTRDIVELVDREADLLVRDTKIQALEGLRKRIATLFLQYCKTPLFNPEAARHIKVPQDASTLRTNVYYCKSCCQYLPSTDFELSTNSRVVDRCKQCRELDNQARARDDLTLYRAMLKTIRHSEERYKDNSHIVFLIQDADLRYLVENIWAGQSAMSGEKDLFELISVRWDIKQHWSPWNCILLTSDEAVTHVKLHNPEEAYGGQFVQKVKHRHVLAKNFFTRIPGMKEGMRSKVTHLPLPRSKERVISLDNNTTKQQQQQQQTVTAK